MTDDKNCGEGCGCGKNHNHSHPSIEDIAYNNHFLLNTLISHLIEKNVITKEELEGAIQKVTEEHQKMAQEAAEEPKAE